MEYFCLFKSVPLVNGEKLLAIVMGFVDTFEHESLFGLIKFHLNAPLGLGSESTQVFKEIHCISHGDLTKKGLRLVFHRDFHPFAWYVVSR